MSENKKPTADQAEATENSVSPEVAEKLDRAIKNVEEGKVVSRERLPRREKAAAPKSIQEALGLPTQPYAVVGSGDTDSVSLANIKYKNMYAKKSLSVYHVQRRLGELGYVEAGGDQGGYFGDGTKAAVERFQRANKWEVTGELTQDQLEKLFDSDPNVTLS